MVIGSKENFAIEADFTQKFGNEAFGKFVIWLKGHRLGDPDELAWLKMCYATLMVLLAVVLFAHHSPADTAASDEGGGPSRRFGVGKRADPSVLSQRRESGSTAQFSSSATTRGVARRARCMAR